MLKLYNTLTRQKEEFKPLIPNQIGMYVCGITVYDRCHLGHARSMVMFDVMLRFFKAEGFQVKFVRNITDIDDKIIKRAKEKGEPIEILTKRYIDAMHQDMQALNLLPPLLEPRATEHIASIIALIQKLLDKKIAYISRQGDVCFEVGQFKSYGKLAHKDLEGLEAGSRIQIDEGKRSPLDFVLWKKAKYGEPEWSSPWGPGRPGWHIECSAMAMEALGEQFDIHGGGSDLQFPHHENEIAQSEAATNKPFANYWLHVGMLKFNEEKMAKSTGNFLTIQEVLEKHHPELIRYFFMSAHYRSPLNYSNLNLNHAEKALNRLYQSLRGVNFKFGKLNQYWLEQFNEAMRDDFNTPQALAILFELSHAINRDQDNNLAYTLYYLGNLLGILNEAPEIFLTQTDENKEEIERLIAARNEARDNKNWQLADEIRDQLLAKGITLNDSAKGTTWRRL